MCFLVNRAARSAAGFGAPQAEKNWADDAF
jgi:hypothetical protein